MNALNVKEMTVVCVMHARTCLSFGVVGTRNNDVNTENAVL